MNTISGVKDEVMSLNNLFIALVSSPLQTELTIAPDLTNIWRTKREVTMYDPNLKLGELRYLNDSNVKTWQDAVRQNRDADVDPRLYKVHHENLLFSLVASLASGLLHLLMSLLSLPVRLMRHKRDDLPLERHLPASR